MKRCPKCGQKMYIDSSKRYYKIDYIYWICPKCGYKQISQEHIE